MERTGFEFGAVQSRPEFEPYEWIFQSTALLTITSVSRYVSNPTLHSDIKIKPAGPMPSHRALRKLFIPNYKPAIS